MRSFQSRNPVPIAVVGLVLMVLAFVAALNADDLPIIGAGTTYEAEFTEAAGLKADDEVRVAGVKVGKVMDVELDDAAVKVTFKVKDTWLGDKTAAAIKIKTLLGQKYLALDPVGEASLDPGTPIPKERTLAPYDVLDAFRDLSTTVEDIDTDQLAQSFDVLSETLSGTSDNVRGALNGLSQLSDTIAKRDTELSQLLSNTNQISRTLADRDQQLTRLLQDGNLVLQEVAAREQAISTLLTGAQELSRQLQGLVTDNDAQLTPVLTSLDQLTGMLQRNQDSLAQGIARFAPYIRVFTNTVGNGHWFDNYICGLILPSVGPLNEEGCNQK
ncbi:MCE family protein [Amycolatopsis endophytica]|uniref:Phospholipid/cholesterol/gamma-HCH transport system substrate-binding protein n=1 Tax=Amycolatopsis endophytica TaxID=860233 RepID=A0A853AYZ9_9PSEU|nr:MCE family protein [Amycolatopsis endophytica]NYI87824.1 phospholipid/cholesterol/gamma-HCH transport system substrate-binding protein [Amycolatopsis endophytica]